MITQYAATYKHSKPLVVQWSYFRKLSWNQMHKTVRLPTLASPNGLFAG